MLVTANVIVDAERGYVTFGANGAVMVTAATGLFLRRILGPAKGRKIPDAARTADVTAVNSAR